MRLRWGWVMMGPLLAVCWSTASCGGRLDEKVDPPADLSDELSRHGGAVCPTTLPRAPRSTYGFGTEEPATTEPVLSKPHRAWVCRYDSHNVAQEGYNGAWYEWVRMGAPRRLDVQELDTFWSDLGHLTVPADDRACNADLGPRYLVAYTSKRELTGVVIDDYGCRDVRLTDDPFTTVPGDASQAGTVPGVLAGSSDLLHDIGAG